MANSLGALMMGSGPVVPAGARLGTEGTEHGRACTRQEPQGGREGDGWAGSAVLGIPEKENRAVLTAPSHPQVRTSKGNVR